MDSLTQLVFGAACGEAVLGKKVGRKALIWGAILGTVPDLDVFIPLGGPVNDFVYQRSFSHSLFFKVAKLNPSRPTPIDDERLATSQDWRGLAWVWKRIWSPTPTG